MIVGVVNETYPNEHRVAMTPAVIASLIKAGLEVLVQAGAGSAAGFVDNEYQLRGARIAASRAEVFQTAQIICQIRTSSANPHAGRNDLSLINSRHTLIGLANPFGAADALQQVAATGAQVFALELLPRITRAQSMDVLSSQATLVGYKAVLLAAVRCPRMFPMMMTAAGTIAPAKVLVVGAGVAGLQAIATSRKLGAVVHAYDVRPAVKEQIESLGAKFLQMDLSISDAEDKGGYAKAMDETFYRKQREMMSKAVAHSDVVITTAAVPGSKAPVLITAEMVHAMMPGSVIIDLAAKPEETGGNCELTEPDREVIANNVTILGPTNLPATVPQTASQLFAKNLATFVLHLVKDGKLNVDLSDEISSATLLSQNGMVVNQRVKETFAKAAVSSMS